MPHRRTSVYHHGTSRNKIMETGYSQQSSPYSYSSPIAFAPAPAFFPEPCYGYASSAAAQPNQYAVPQSQGYSMPEATSQHCQPTQYSNFPQSGGTPDVEMSNQPPPIHGYPPNLSAQVPQWSSTFDVSTAQGTPGYSGQQNAQPQAPTYSNTVAASQGHEHYQQPQPPPTNVYPPNPPAQVSQWPESPYGYSAAQGSPGYPGAQHAQPQVPTYSNTVPPPQGHKQYQPEPQPQKNTPHSQAGQQQDNRPTNPPPAWPYPPGQSVQFQINNFAPGHSTVYVPFMMPPVPAGPQDKSSPPSSMYI